MKTLFNFENPYTKLKKKQFTVIRDINYDVRHNFHIPIIGMIALTHHPFAVVKILSYKDIMIQDIDLDLLKLDMNYNDVKITSHEEFIDFFNSLGLQIKFSLTSRARIYWVKKLRDLTGPPKISKRRSPSRRKPITKSVKRSPKKQIRIF